MSTIDDEPITARVKNEVERFQNRRFDDKVQYWVKMIVPVILGGLIAWLLNVRDGMNRHDIFIAQNTSALAQITVDIKELQTAKNTGQNMEQLINKQLENMEIRLSEQDKRLQMQGEGLIVGNKSIHDALEKLMFITSELSKFDNRIYILESDEQRMKRTRK